MKIRHICLTHYENNELCYRTHRLAAVVGYLYGISNMQTRWLKKITALHDHKGILEVRSTTPLTREEQTIVGAAWEDIGHEDKEHVEYYLTEDNSCY